MLDETKVQITKMGIPMIYISGTDGVMWERPIIDFMDYRRNHRYLQYIAWLTKEKSAKSADYERI